MVQRLNQIFDKAGEGFLLQRRAGDLLEESAQKGIGARDQLLRFFTSKAGTAAGDAGAEQAVGQRLGEHIGELRHGFGFFLCVNVGSKFRQQGAGESIAPITQLL